MARYNKISVISFFAAWCVVIYHSCCGSSIERWALPIFSYWVVPWFLLVSGYFLLASYDKRGTVEFVAEKLKSLVIPYILWCLIGLGIYWIAYPDAVELSLVKIFACGAQSSPSYNRPLWYLRTLIIFNALACCLLRVLRLLKIGTGVLRLIVFLCLFLPIVLIIPRVGINIYGPGSTPIWFVAGIVLSYVCRTNAWCLLERCLGYVGHKAIGIIFLLAFIAARGYWFVTGHSFSASGAGGNILGNISTLSLIIAIWFLFDMFATKVNGLCNITSWRSAVLGTGAFIYFFHRPLLTCIIKRLNCVGPMADIEFIALAILYAPVCFMMALLIKKAAPRVYDVLTGGR